MDESTLDEARVELARRECEMAGHEFETIVTHSGNPTTILCSRCGKWWSVDDPTDERP